MPTKIYTLNGFTLGSLESQVSLIIMLEPHESCIVNGKRGLFNDCVRFMFIPAYGSHASTVTLSVM